MSTPYQLEELHHDEDDGTMYENLDALTDAVVGHRIISAEQKEVPGRWYGTEVAFILTLDNGTRVQMVTQGDCCAYTELETFMLHVDKIDHIITGVGTTDGFTKWHVYADMGDVLEFQIDWSAGNTGYYAYGFDITVIPVDAA
ncbi:hypothetical protein QNA24_30050 [Rhodococcus qingshengii]|uniref:DUF7448 domain-containing protein n=1 Tax=Rhodococcus TaxID=1827 RepID=UPI001E4ECBCA|nr:MULTISPECIES: hypothetical protein [Rhodococcus]MCD2099613.1 hypothetical protein [Rhodococcus rhodochrous]MCD2123981.1 hypothetical protein [Rhodococcus rhodochrous]MCQ4136587.1 hypothetical protein [Rhodococcus rhodochrous]MDJ0490627.1 hypothetical protein [Rhodococcus qingshengii]